MSKISKIGNTGQYVGHKVIVSDNRLKTFIRQRTSLQEWSVKFGVEVMQETF